MSSTDTKNKNTITIDPPWLEACILANKAHNIYFGDQPKKKSKVCTEGNYLTNPKTVVVLEVQPHTYFKALNSSDASTVNNEEYLELECIIAIIFDGLHIVRCLLYPNVLGLNITSNSIPTPSMMKLIKYRPQLFYLPDNLTKTKFKREEYVKFTNHGCLLSIKKAQLLNTESIESALGVEDITSVPCLSQNDVILDFWKNYSVDYGLKDPKSEQSTKNITIPNSARSGTIYNSSIKVTDPFGEQSLSAMFWKIPFDQQEQIDLLVKTLPGWENLQLQEEVLDDSLPSTGNISSLLQNEVKSSLFTNQQSTNLSHSRPTPIDSYIMSNATVLVDEDLEDLALLFSSPF